MPLNELQRGFLQLIGASGGGAAAIAKADPAKRKAFLDARAAAITDLELLDGQPGAPKQRIDAFVKELNAQLALAGRGSLDEARTQTLALHGKIREAAAALKNDPALKSYQDQLAQANRLAADIQAGLDELKTYAVHARLTKDVAPVLKRKAEAEVAASAQPAARSLEVMTAVVKSLGPLQKVVAGVLAERAAWEAVATPARRELGILSAMQRGNPSNLARKLADAEALARRGDFVPARDALKGFDKEVAAQQETAAKLEKAMLAQFEKLGLYEERLARASALRKEMMVLPGTRDVRNQVDDAIKLARELARKSDYAAAAERLKKVDDIKLADMQKASGKALAKAEKDPEFVRLRQEAQAEVKKLEGLAVESVTVAFREDMLVLFDRIASGVDVAANMQSLRRLVEKARQRVAELEAEKKTAVAKVRAVENHVRAIAAAAGEGAAAPFMLRSQQFANALLQGRFREVTEAATALETEAAAAVAKANAAQADWAKAEGEMKAMQAACAKIVEPAAVKAEALGIVARLAEIRGLAQGPTRDLEVALAAVQAQKAVLEAVQKKAADFVALGKERTAATQRFDARFAEVKAALDTLAAAVDQARAGETADEGERAALGFEARRDELAARWKGIAAAALTKEALTIDAVLKDVDALIAEITAAAQPEGVKKTVAQQKLVEAQRRFEAAWPLAEEAIRALQTVDVGEGDLALSLAQAARTLAATDPEAAFQKLAAIEADVNKRTGDATTRRDEDRAAVKTLATTVAGELDALQKKADSKLFEPMFADLRNQHAALLLAADSDNADAIAEARADLRTLRKKVAEMAARIGMPGPDMDDFKGVQGKLDTIKAELAKAELKERVPSRVATLTESLAAAMKTLPSKTPTEAMAQLRELERMLSEVKEAASLAKARRDAFDNHAKSVSARIKQLDSELAWTKTLPGRLEALRKRSRTEGGEPRALDDLDRLDQDIAGALKDPAVAQALDTAARAEALKKEQDKVVWAGRLKTFQAVDLPAAERAVAGGGDKTQIDELKRLVKSAENLAKAGDHAQANTSLDMARARAEQIVQNPAGTTIGTRNELPKDVGIYKGAVTKLNAALLAFPNAVKAAAGAGIDPALVGKLTDTVKKLALVFPPGAFDVPVARLTAAEADANARRAAREQGLSAVRALQTQLQQHPGLTSLQTNPIDAAPIQTAMSGLYYALNRLEGNLLRACK